MIQNGVIFGTVTDFFVNMSAFFAGAAIAATSSDSSWFGLLVVLSDVVFALAFLVVSMYIRNVELNRKKRKTV